MTQSIDRFIVAQKQYYEKALSEVIKGKKETCWMWFIFPQLKGLGCSETSIYYGLNGVKETKLYWCNEYLRNNLLEITKEVFLHHTDFGYIDTVKLLSCMELFYKVSKNEIFKKVYNMYKE